MTTPTKTTLLHPSVQKIVDHYFNLNIAGQLVPAIYYINQDISQDYRNNNPVPDETGHYKKRFSQKNAWVGKGRPEELEIAAAKTARKYKIDLSSSSISEIRQFLKHYGLGVDCSGFVVWILNEFCRQKYGQSVWKFLDFGKTSWLRKLKIFLFPVQNISVAVLDDRKNSTIINGVNDIQLGDLIINQNGKHVMLINQIWRGPGNKVRSFEYVNCTWWYGDGYGVRKGLVEILNIEGSLAEQKWLDDFDENGINWAFEGTRQGSWLIRLNLK